jgi:hypothetical protein
MSRQNNQNRSNPKQEIPVMSKDEIASLFATRAEAAKAVQLYRADGSPVVGALFLRSELLSKSKRYNDKKGHCRLLCCSERRPLVEPHFFSEPANYPDPFRTAYEPQEGEWVSVEKRSVRRLKTRAKFAKDDEKVVMRPNVLYAMYDD